MKKLFFSLMCVLALALFAVSCTSENESGLDNSEAVAELSFEVNLLGNPNEGTKSYTTEHGICATHEVLTTLAAQNNLTLNVTIKAAGATAGIDYHPKIRWTGSKFVADPILLAAGGYSTIAATVTNGNNDVLFSAVTSGSAYASYIPELLPKGLIVGVDVPLYQKTSLDIYMMCVLKETPKDFGFVKWNINFTKVYCVPFITNMCEDKEHFVASGTLRIQNGTMAGDKFTPVTGEEQPVKWAKIDNTIYFNSGSNPLPELCFADNYNIDNTEEYYMFTLDISSRDISPSYIGAPVIKRYIGYANIETLLEYNDKLKNDAWDDINNVIHFNFCDDKQWFFKEIVNLIAIPINSHLNYYPNLDAFKDVVQTKHPDNEMFKDGFEDFVIKNVDGEGFRALIIPAGSKIRFKSYFSLDSEINSYVNVDHQLDVPNGTQLDNVYTVNIYSDKFLTPIDEIRCPWSFSYINHVSTLDAPTCISNISGDHYIELVFNETVNYVTYLIIQTTFGAECPAQTVDY